MACVFWIIVILCPLLAHSQSGDTGLGDAEISDAFCSSIISFKINSLHCEMDEEDKDSIDHVQLCSQMNACVNGTLKTGSFNFPEVQSTIGTYQLLMYHKGEVVNTQKIDLVKIVKLPTPTVQNITLSSDMVIIYIKFQHDFVIEPKFQVELWKAKHGAQDPLVVEVGYQPVTIGTQFLKGNGTYHVHVRVKPGGDYFNGSWTPWSPVKKFNLCHFKAQMVGEDPPYSVYIIIGTSIIVVIGMLLVILRWKKEIKAYISPNIPNPKATLAHIHREKERPPVSFSPEIFKDISINRVDYAEEKQLDPELEEGQDDTAGICQNEEDQDGEDSSSRLEDEMSHLKIKLLDQPEDGENQVVRPSQASVRRDCRDETYVTMSSLYKTE